MYLWYRHRTFLYIWNKFKKREKKEKNTEKWDMHTFMSVFFRMPCLKFCFGSDSLWVSLPFVHKYLLIKLSTNPTNPKPEWLIFSEPNCHCQCEKHAPVVHIDVLKQIPKKEKCGSKEVKRKRAKNITINNDRPRENEREREKKLYKKITFQLRLHASDSHDKIRIEYIMCMIDRTRPNGKFRCVVGL